MLEYNTHSDQQLIALLKQSNQLAIAEIYERYWDRLLAVALNRLDNLEEAEECVQDVFLKLWKLREGLELKYSLYTYLSAAVRYRVLDLLDKQYRGIQYARGVLDEMIEMHSLNDEPDANLLERELLEQIEAAIKKLPEKCQIVYRMSREEDKSHKQIASTLDISEKTVEAHLTKAIKNIKNDLSITLPGIIWFCFNNIHHKL